MCLIKMILFFRFFSRETTAKWHLCSAELRCRLSQIFHSDVPLPCVYRALYCCYSVLIARNSTAIRRVCISPVFHRIFFLVDSRIFVVCLCLLNSGACSSVHIIYSWFVIRPNAYSRIRKRAIVYIYIYIWNHHKCYIICVFWKETRKTVPSITVHLTTS